MQVTSTPRINPGPVGHPIPWPEPEPGTVPAPRRPDPDTIKFKAQAAKPVAPKAAVDAKEAVRQAKVLTWGGVAMTGAGALGIAMFWPAFPALLPLMAVAATLGGIGTAVVGALKWAKAG